MGVLLGSFLYIRNRRHRISKRVIFSSNSACNRSLDQGELSHYVAYILFKLLQYKSVKNTFICTQRNVSLVITFGLKIKTAGMDVSYLHRGICCFICLLNIGISSAEFVVGHLNLIVNVHMVSSLTFWAVNSLSSKNKGFSPLICIVLNINSAIKNYTYCLNSSQLCFVFCAVYEMTGILSVEDLVLWYSIMSW